MSGALQRPPTPRELLERAITRRYYPDHVASEINRAIDAFGLAGSGYDPTWLARRRAAREKRERKAAIRRKALEAGR